MNMKELQKSNTKTASPDQFPPELINHQLPVVNIYYLVINNIEYSTGQMWSGIPVFAQLRGHWLL